MKEKKNKNNKKTIGIVVAVTALVIVAIAIATYYINPAELLTKNNKIVIGISQSNQETYWETATTKYFERTFKEKDGYSLIIKDGKKNKNEQINDIEKLIKKKVDYIIIDPIEETGWDQVLEKAKKAEISVIIYNKYISVSDNGLYKTWVGSNFIQQGKDGANWLKNHLISQDQLDKQMNIVTLLEEEGSNKEKGIRKGFNDTAAEVGQWKIIDEKSALGSLSKGKEVMAEFLKEHDKIDVVVAQNDDMMMGALEAIEEAGKTTGINGDIIVITYGANSDAFDMLEEEKINIAIETSPMYGEAIKKIIDKLENNPITKLEKVHYLKDEIFMPNTAIIDRVGRFY